MTRASLPTRMTKSWNSILILSVAAKGHDGQNRFVIAAAVKFRVLPKALGVKGSSFFFL